MSQGVEGTIFYFKEKGAGNTEKTLDIALACCREREIGKIVVASSTGKTAMRLGEKAGGGMEIIAVSYGAGSRFVEEVREFNKNMDTLHERGIKYVRGILALSGTERSFQNKYGSGLLPLNIVADTLRMFSQGIKVCVEVAVMAAEHGFITPEEDVVVVAGSGHGSDTAVVLKPAYAARMFDIRFRSILCMPS